MELNSLKNYRKDRVKYKFENGAFVHNFSEDYHVLLIQKNKYAEVTEQLKSHSFIENEYDLLWTKGCIAENIQRLSIGKDSLCELNKNIDLDLKVIIIKIDSAKYKLNNIGVYSVVWPSGDFTFLLNNVILHSYNIETFFMFSSLLLGPKFINDEGQLVELPRRINLAGVSGWENFHEMFKVANFCSNWLVLRNAEYLPDNFWGNDKDIDVLCDELPQFLSAVNATKKANGVANYEVTVESKIVDVDARYVGDEYYDRLWQQNMLLNKMYDGEVPRLNLENYFFSLLYHARIHKKSVKPIYIPRLLDMAQKLGLECDESIFGNNKLCAHFLDSYFEQNHYLMTFPLDYACYENINKDVTQYVQLKKKLPINLLFVFFSIKNQLFLYACKLLPKSIKDGMKRALNK